MVGNGRQEQRDEIAVVLFRERRALAQCSKKLSMVGHWIKSVTGDLYLLRVSTAATGPGDEEHALMVFRLGTRSLVQPETATRIL